MGLGVRVLDVNGTRTSLPHPSPQLLKRGERPTYRSARDLNSRVKIAAVKVVVCAVAVATHADVNVSASVAAILLDPDAPRAPSEVLPNCSEYFETTLFILSTPCTRQGRQSAAKG